MENHKSLLERVRDRIDVYRPFCSVINCQLMLLEKGVDLNVKQRLGYSRQEHHYKTGAYRRRFYNDR